ncbi:hypothetical protein NKG05_14535 [Oerskovia sp. M15]
MAAEHPRLRRGDQRPAHGRRSPHPASHGRVVVEPAVRRARRRPHHRAGLAARRDHHAAPRPHRRQRRPVRVRGPQRAGIRPGPARRRAPRRLLPTALVRVRDVAEPPSSPRPPRTPSPRSTPTARSRPRCTSASSASPAPTRTPPSRPTPDSPATTCPAPWATASRSPLRRRRTLGHRPHALGRQPRLRDVHRRRRAPRRRGPRRRPAGRRLPHPALAVAPAAGIEGRAAISLKAVAERTALLAYAARAAGVRTPRLLGVAQSDDSMILVQEHAVGAVSLRDLPDDEVTDAVLTEAWHQIRLAHDAGSRTVP